jgi:uncharacterized membrane protein
MLDNRRRGAVLPLLLLALAACGGPKEEAPTSPPAGASAAPAPAAHARLRGIATTSGDATRVVACGAPTSSSVALDDADHAIDQARSTIGAPPTEPIYVELEGAAGSDEGPFRVSTLLRARASDPAGACRVPVFEGDYLVDGADTPWTVEIRDDAIVYRGPAHPAGRTFPYAFTRTETGSIVYATRVDKPSVSTLEAALEPGLCFDARTKEVRGFTAHVAIDGKKLEGCAATGVPGGEYGPSPLDELNRYAGTYPRAAGLWSRAPIKGRLTALLGRSMTEFVDDMRVEGPLIKDRGVFYAIGNAPHRGGSDLAVFLADPATDTIEVVLSTGKVRRSLKEGGRDVPPPAEVAAVLGSPASP